MLFGNYGNLVTLSTINTGGGGTSITVTMAALTLGVKNTTVLTAFAVGHSALTLAARNATTALAMTLTHSALTLTARSATTSQSFSVGEASLTLVGKLVTFTANTTIAITAGALTLTPARVMEFLSRGGSHIIYGLPAIIGRLLRR